VVIDEKKIVIIHPPRCGGTTLDHAVLGMDSYNVDPFHKHLSLFELVYFFKATGRKPNSYRWYALIRNPVSRCVSMYQTGYWTACAQYYRQSMRDVSLAQFAAIFTPALHERGKVSLCDYLDARSCDVAITHVDIESLDKFASEVLDLPSIKNHEVGVEPAPLISKLAQAVVAWRFRHDFVSFGYKMPRPYGPLSLPIGFLSVGVFKLLKKSWVLLIGLLNKRSSDADYPRLGK
jgi:hypothetical protein